MTWSIDVDPLGSLALSALVAALPIFFLFWALAIKKMQGHRAAIFAAILSLTVATSAFGMPIELAILSFLKGFIFGLWPICYIVITVVFIFNLSLKTGQFDMIRQSLTSVTKDIRIMAVLIAFVFGSFLEGAAGFGTPVAITAAMLVGFGLNPVVACGICLISNTAPVAFGAIGIPVIVGAQVSEVDLMALSQMVGRQLSIFSLFIPFYVVVVLAGFRGALEIWQILAVTGVSFAATNFLVSNYLGPYLPNILASIVSAVTTIGFLKLSKLWDRNTSSKPCCESNKKYSYLELLHAWSPFILLSILVISWGLEPVKVTLDQLATFRIPFPYLDKAVLSYDGKPIPAFITLNLLSTPGTAILVAGILATLALRLSGKEVASVAINTMKQLKYPIITIGTIIGFAYLYNFSGMAITLGYAFASTGVVFPFFAAFLGWLGVFMTGSDTSSNALFGRLQEVTARQLGIDPVLTVATNSSGGVFGKMISPQSIAVATAATGYVGHEGDIFRFTLKHSIILTFLMGVLAMLQAYVFTWMIPEWEQAVETYVQAAKQAQVVPSTQGLIYIVATFAVSLFIVILSRAVSK